MNIDISQILDNEVTDFRQYYLKRQRVFWNNHLDLIAFQLKEIGIILDICSVNGQKYVGGSTSSRFVIKNQIARIKEIDFTNDWTVGHSQMCLVLEICDRWKRNEIIAEMILPYWKEEKTNQIGFGVNYWGDDDVTICTLSNHYFDENGDNTPDNITIYDPKKHGEMLCEHCNKPFNQHYDWIKEND